MLRYPPLNVQAVCTDEIEEDTVRASPDDAPWRDPAGSSQKERESAVAIDS